MWEKRKKEERLGLWIEAERERLSARAYALEDAFLRAFFAQCVESTAADAYEVFLETPLAYNYFRENLGRMDEKTLARFFKLAAIYHTIRTVRRRKSGLDTHVDRVDSGFFAEWTGEEDDRAPAPLCGAVSERLSGAIS